LQRIDRARQPTARVRARPATFDSVMWLWVLVGGSLGYGLARIFIGHPPPPAGLRRLSRGGAAFVAAAADALFPPGGAVEPSGSEAGVLAYVDGYLDRVPPRPRLLMRLLFFLFQHATVFFPARHALGFRRFSALPPEQQVEVLSAWSSSRLFPRRLAFMSLRAILTMGYFADPAVLHRLGLAPRAIATPVREADLLYPPIGASPAAIAYGPTDLSPPREGVPLGADGEPHPDYAEARP
jgi:hypothetical protein